MNKKPRRLREKKLSESIWNEYRDRFVHPDAGDNQLTETKRAYIFGMNDAMTAVSAIANTLSEGMAANAMEIFQAELNEFRDRYIDSLKAEETKGGDL